MSSTPYRDSQVRRVSVTVAAGQTDSVLLEPTSTRRVRVVALHAQAVGLASNFTLNSKGSGAGVALSAALGVASGEPVLWPFDPNGWLDTLLGESLTVTTGAGGSVALTMTLALVAADGTLLAGEDSAAILLENGTELLLEV